MVAIICVKNSRASTTSVIIFLMQNVYFFKKHCNFLNFTTSWWKHEMTHIYFRSYTQNDITVPILDTHVKWHRKRSICYFFMANNHNKFKFWNTISSTWCLLFLSVLKLFWNTFFCTLTFGNLTFLLLNNHFVKIFFSDSLQVKKLICNLSLQLY